MKRRIISLLKRLQPHGTLFAVLSCFWLALVLLLFRLHDLRLLAGLAATLYLFFWERAPLGLLVAPATTLKQSSPGARRESRMRHVKRKPQKK